jgi:outer membrane protein assembly factor BamD
MTVGRCLAACIVAGVILAAALVSPCDAKEKVDKKTASLPPEEVYAAALRKIEKKKYYSARVMLQELLPRIPPEDRDLLPRVQMSLGDAFFRDGGLANYGEALNAYRNFLTYFPQNEKASYAQMMVGQSLYRQVSAPDRDQTTTMKALEELRKVETAWPDSPWAAEAREVMELCYNRLAEKERLVGHFYQQRKQWLAALDRYRMVTEAYPRYDGMSQLLLDMGRCELAANRREEAQESFTRLAQRDGSEKLVKLANLAMRHYDRRREKEGEQLYGDLAGQDGKKKGTTP